MIDLRDVNKSFDGIQALQNVSGVIRDGSIFGLVGSNGAGKSTCIRMMAGILRPDSGRVLADEQDIFENECIKSNIFYISDEQYFSMGATPKKLMDYYGLFYPRFDKGRFGEYIRKLGLKDDGRIASYSKGMKKQLSFLLGICANTKYLLCDEVFDGLDAAMRQTVKSIFAEELINRQLTPVIASHNLRELEDICDDFGLLHQGRLLLSGHLQDMKENVHRLQCVVSETEKHQLLEELDIIKAEERGSLLVLTVRGTREAIEEKIRVKNTVFYEITPLTFEEIFISETGAAGYDIKKLLL